MATEYKIYLVNKSDATQIFWCFLQRPQELVNDPGVYANSSTSLAVPSLSPAINTFTIPVQYIVGAGASNKAVGLNIKVDSSIARDAELTERFDAEYVDVPPPMGPTLLPSSETSPANTIAISSNKFNKAANEAAGWFGNMSFGIQTAQGFIGMSWSPQPNVTRTITPTLKFYVAVGRYGANNLASWNEVSNGSAEIVVPTSFSLNKTTVTYTPTGTWEVTPGAPATLDLEALANSHYRLEGQVRGLMDYARTAATQPSALLAGKPSQQETVVSVDWSSSSDYADFEFLTGTLAVSTALVAGFAYFIISGVEFEIISAPKGGTAVTFSYSGTRSANEIKELVKAGAEAVFKRS